MKQKFRFALAIVVGLSLFSTGVMTGVLLRPKGTPTVDVLFSPKGGCTAAIVAEINGAKQSIKVQAYSFTSKEVVAALASAHQRKVGIQVILDNDNDEDRYSTLPVLLENGIPTWLDGKHSIAHNKIILIDGRVIITGSFNFTKQAETSNAENLLILKNHPLQAQYESNFEKHLSHSVKK